MGEKHRVLWIEDGARHDLPELAAPVYMDGNYDLIVAESASEGESYMLGEKFDVIIVDVRLPPGDDPRWADLYRRAGSDKVAARLGLKLLYSLLGSPRAEVVPERHPLWVSPHRIGILTVESQTELEADLEELSIGVFTQKNAAMPETVLLDLIREVLSQQA